MAKRVRVRSKRLEEIDESKLALAFLLLARMLVEQQAKEQMLDRPAAPNSELRRP